MMNNDDNNINYNNYDNKLYSKYVKPRHHADSKMH